MTKELLSQVAKEYGSPAFLFDTEALKCRMQEIKSIVGEEISLCYSIKANPFLIDTMLSCVDKLEVCSPGELSICERLNVPAETIIYSGVNKGKKDIADAMGYNVYIYTAESLHQLKLLQEEALATNTTRPVLLRLNANSQFGMSKEDLISAIKDKEKYPNIDIQGIHYFAGTQRKRLKDQVEELEMLAALIDELKVTYAYEVKKLEYGPGLPVPYFSKEDFNDTLAPIKELAPALKSIAKKVALTIEMGRFYTAECGYYFTEVEDIKSSNDGTMYAIMDGGMNHLSYLGQTMGLKVPLIEHIKYDNTLNSDEKQEYCLCGSICSTNDVMVRRVELDKLELGDILVFKNTGAYSVTEGIYLFLSRTLPRILLHKGNGKIQMVRDFEESYEINIPR